MYRQFFGLKHQNHPHSSQCDSVVKSSAIPNEELKQFFSLKSVASGEAGRILRASLDRAYPSGFADFLGREDHLQMADIYLPFATDADTLVFMRVLSKGLNPMPFRTRN